MKLIIGLGNPGKQYAKTRHNVGWMVQDACASIFNFKFLILKKVKGEIAKTDKAIFLKPLTFMNNSGESVQTAINYYKLKLSDLIVVHDDKDIELGKIKVQTGHSDAGHNGIKSIVQHLGTNDFTRVRVGIANDKLKYQDTATFVLKKFGLLEKKKLKEGINKAVEEIVSIIDKK